MVPRCRVQPWLDGQTWMMPRWRSALQRHAAQPLIDANGQVAFDQAGNPMTAMDHVESWTGERQGEGVWLGERSRRRELRKPQTTHVSGDPDAPAGTPEARRTAIPTSTRAIADAMIAQDARLQPRSQSAVGRRFTVAEGEARARRLSHPDYSGETMRERAKRIRQIQPRQRQPVQLSNARTSRTCMAHSTTASARSL
jgi:hypothetical protein